jgi:dihydroneopterin aldolase/D-erythro-7,8-dihydroneopterin triphosphate epimerase
MADAPLDAIRIRELRARCIVGINPDEREKKQEVTIHLTLYADLRRAGRTDRIEDTVDYRSLKKAVLAEVEASSYFLVERLAERVAEIALGYRGVERVVVVVEKPGALRFARTVGVEILRERARDD